MQGVTAGLLQSLPAVAPASNAGFLALGALIGTLSFAAGFFACAVFFRSHPRAPFDLEADQ